MCGRMVSTTTRAQLVEWFGAGDVVGDELQPSWNVAPGRDVYVVAPSGSGLRLGTMRWGLVASWSDGPSSGPRPFNARAESLLDRPAFADAAARRRCIVPADGFYEWDAGRRPFHLSAPDGSPLAFAAVWDRWTSPDGESTVSVAVVTTPAGPDVAPLHDRMPVILPRAAWPAWLDRGDRDGAAACSLLQPVPAGSLRARPANRVVNHVANDGPQLLTPADEPARLF